MNQEQEINLLRDIKDGSAGSFSILYESYGPLLYQHIFRMVKDDDQTKEVLQETFIKVWTARQTIDLDKPFKFFIYTIAKNLVHDYFRQLAKEKSLQEKLIQKFSDSSYFEDELLQKKRYESLVEDMLAQLPAQRQLVYRLCKIERKSYKEVSEALGVSVTTISDHMTKANKVVRAYLIENKSRILIALFLFLFKSI